MLDPKCCTLALASTRATTGIALTAGLGPSAGQVWRVGLMGYNATAANIELVLTAFRQGLAEQGYTKSQPKTQNPQESRVDYP